MNAKRPWAVGLIGASVVVLSLVVIWHGMWATAGIGAFAEQWGGRLAGVIDEPLFRQVHPGVSLPDRGVLASDLQQFAGHRLQAIMLGQIAMLLGGVALLVIACIPSRSRAVKGPA